MLARAVSRTSVSSTRLVPAAARLAVDPDLKAFVDEAVLPGTGVEAAHFWNALGGIADELAPRNRELLLRRDSLQAQIDAWHLEHREASSSGIAHANFLHSIGYLTEEQPPFVIGTEKLDQELLVAGPQLVCPIENSRFILNAANARWGSLLDVVYGTDVLPGEIPGAYSAERGARAFSFSHDFLDEIFPLDGAKWGEVTSLDIEPSTSVRRSWLRATCAGRDSVYLRDGAQLVGYLPGIPTARSLLLRNNGLHAEILVDRSHPIGASHPAGIKDVRLESALSTICDMEDSACTVDAADKMRAYANWLGLMKGDLAAPLVKNGKQTVRKMEADRTWTSATAPGSMSLPGRALLLCRNVGLHMYTDAATHAGEPLPEHFLDAMVTAASAMHDLRGNSPVLNSRCGSVYIVKPKMHGPDEVALVAELFGAVERALGLPVHTLKVGVMDEERRTSLNLRQVMHAARDRLFFINTGFLDRTGDEIHTAMEAGPVVPKGNLKAKAWYGAYEQNNTDCGVATGLVGQGQIGKGMWAAPEDMARMLVEKGAQLAAGASTAWVPSPSAATLHALHYHRTCVSAVHAGLVADKAAIASRRAPATAALMTYPLLTGGAASLSAEQIQYELDNDAQGLLGYVVRWVGQGVGCSKVPDLDNVQLMEDRATLRISSQLLANWLHHAVVTEDQVMESLRRMAKVVDAQNEGEPGYKRLAPAYDGPEWQAALELVFKGREHPNGYTEATLAHWRRVRKALDAEGQ